MEIQRAGTEMQNAGQFDRGFMAEASNALRKLMTSLATQRSLEEGEILFAEGDEGDTLYAIISGMLEFSVTSVDGRKLGLDVMRDGAVFGEIALFDPGPRTATVTAIEPTRVWGVKHADVRAALVESPELSIDLIQLAGHRMRWMGEQLSEHVFLSLSARLARKILHLTALSDDRGSSLRFSQADLAEFIGASREAVSKSLSAWKRDGIIELSRGGIKVLDREALRKQASNQIF
jgi:CRP-like cAMP-binding protein